MVANLSSVTVPETKPFKWPANLYQELYDMSSVSFLIYAIGYIVDTARKEGGLKGLKHKDGCQFRQESSDSRNFTPKEVLGIIENNRDALKKVHPAEFDDGMFRMFNGFFDRG